MITADCRILLLIRNSTAVKPLSLSKLTRISDVEKSFRRGDGLFQVMPDIVAHGHRGGEYMTISHHLCYSPFPYFQG